MFSGQGCRGDGVDGVLERHDVNVASVGVPQFARNVVEGFLASTRKSVGKVLHRADADVDRVVSQDRSQSFRRSAGKSNFGRSDAVKLKICSPNVQMLKCSLK